MKKRLGTQDANDVITLLAMDGIVAPAVQLHEFLDCPSGIDIEIKKAKPGRTRQQEKYYRKWCGEFAKSVGTSPDDMHTTILLECYGSKDLHVNGHIYRIPAKRSADTSRGSYSELIETLIRCAAFAEFIVPPPPLPEPIE